MSHKVLVVSPPNGLTEQIRKALQGAVAPSDIYLVSDYPQSSSVRKMILSRSNPIGGVIVDLHDQSRALQLIREVKEANPDIVAVAADAHSSAESILAAMRAGASEYLVPPFDLSFLEKALRKTPAAEQPSRPGRLLCFMPAQGSNGASTAAIHVSSFVARQIEERALLVDFDFHSGTIAFRLRLRPEFTLADSLNRTDVIDELWDRIPCRSGKLEVLAAPPPGARLPQEKIREITAVFQSALQTYDYTIVDLPSALYSSCVEVLALADVIYLVCTPEVMSLHLARRRVNELANFQIPRDKIELVLNRVGSKKTLDTEDVSKVVGVPVRWTLPNDYAAVSDADLKGELVPASSELGRHFRKMAESITGTPRESEPQKGWKGFLSFH